MTNRVKYENWNGVNTAVLWRKKGSKKTDTCIFCGKKHTHGEGEGHRVPHCINDDRLITLIEFKNGVVLNFKDGYILREYS